MIAVIADDFTGAAEIGGIGLRRGMKVVIETQVKHVPDTDLLVIATDTRSFNKEKAADEIRKITRQINHLKPEYTFKKIDSVLRGNVVAELEAQMQESHKEKAIIIAGNPQFNRIIKNGIYYVNGTPLNETFFSKDPQYPIQSSNILEILSNGNDLQNIISQTVDRELPSKGLIFGDVVSKEDMLKWARHIDNTSVIAGGAGFFDSILSYDYPEIKSQAEAHYELGDKTLFVFGSTYPKSDKLIKQINELGMCIVNMPEKIYFNENYDIELLEQWADDIIYRIKKHKKVVVTINHSKSIESGISVRVRETIGALIRKVVDKIAIDDLLIEGGDTTSVILKYLQVHTLRPFLELGHGVIQMNTDHYPNMRITTKPGSYNWPENIWISESTKAQTK